MTHGFNFLVLMLISARVKRLRASRLQKNSFFPLEIVTFPFLPPAWAKTASCCQLIPLVIPLNPQLAPRHSSPAQALPNIYPSQTNDYEFPVKLYSIAALVADYPKCNSHPR